MKLRAGDSVNNTSLVTAYMRLARGHDDALIGAGDTRKIPSGTHGYIVEIDKQRGSRRVLVRWTYIGREYFGWHDPDLLVKERVMKNPISHEARELSLFIQNDGELYRRQTLPIIENLAKKIKKGVFKHTLAVKLFRYLADNGAKKYTFEFDDKRGASSWPRVKGFGAFSVKDRTQAAHNLLRYYFEHIRERAGKPHVFKNPADTSITIISDAQARDITDRLRAFESWLDSKRKRPGAAVSYHPSEIPAGLKEISNDERGKLEVYNFVKQPPEKYFLYINDAGSATTWNGEFLGSVTFGSSYQTPAFYTRSTRVPVTIRAINGFLYHGTYFKSSGNYARIKRGKRWATAVVK